MSFSLVIIMLITHLHKILLITDLIISFGICDYDGLNIYIYIYIYIYINDRLNFLISRN